VWQLTEDLAFATLKDIQEYDLKFMTANQKAFFGLSSRGKLISID
jgi:hypothetical protein